MGFGGGRSRREGRYHQRRRGGGADGADGLQGDSESDFAEEAVSGGPEISGLYSTVPSGLPHNITPAVSQQGAAEAEGGDPDRGVGGGLALPLAAAYLDLLPHNPYAATAEDDDDGNTSDSSAVTDLRVDDDVSHVATALLKMKELERRRVSSALAAQSSAAAAALMWASNNNDPQLLAAAAAEAAMGFWPDGGFGFALGPDGELPFLHGGGGGGGGAGGGAHRYWDDDDGVEDDDDPFGSRRRSKVRRHGCL